MSNDCTNNASLRMLFYHQPENDQKTLYFTATNIYAPMILRQVQAVPYPSLCC